MRNSSLQALYAEVGVLVLVLVLARLSAEPVYMVYIRGYLTSKISAGGSRLLPTSYNDAELES